MSLFLAIDHTFFPIKNPFAKSTSQFCTHQFQLYYSTNRELASRKRGICKYEWGLISDQIRSCLKGWLVGWTARQ